MGRSPLRDCNQLSLNSSPVHTINESRFFDTSLLGSRTRLSVHLLYHCRDRCSCIVKKEASAQASATVSTHGAVLSSSAGSTPTNRSDPQAAAGRADRYQRNREGEVQVLWSAYRRDGSSMPVLRSA